MLAITTRRMVWMILAPYRETSAQNLTIEGNDSLIGLEAVMNGGNDFPNGLKIIESNFEGSGTVGGEQGFTAAADER